MKKKALIITLMLLAALAGCEQKVAHGVAAATSVDAKPVSMTKAAVHDPQPMSMGFSPAEFLKRFNDQASTRKMEFRIISTQLKTGNEIADQWVYQFDDRLGFLAPVNRTDGTIRSITYVGAGDGTLESGGRLMFCLMLLIRAIDPALTDKTANTLALDLLSTMQSKKQIERIQNGLRYSSDTAEGIGLMVAVNPSQ